MTTGSAAMDRFVILADESAEWKIAGLRQLDRLVLALNEFAGSIGSAVTLQVVIFWRPDIASRTRWLPNDARMQRVRTTESLSSLRIGACIRVITTRLFVGRNGLGHFLEVTPSVQLEGPIVDLPESWRRLYQQFEASTCAGADQDWRYLESEADIRRCEQIFLRGAGKSQDGIVSKSINRPLSRSITRFLLKFPIEPTTWTLSIFVLAIISFLFLWRGGYINIAIGTVIYQLFSMLDGCDGEIARAKYLESKRGGRVDDFCDIVGSLFFMIGLGFGLSHSSSSHAVWYPIEGIFCAVLIATNELLLRVSNLEANVESNTLSRALYPRHRQLIEHSGVLFLGEKFVWWVLQLTKRDVCVLFFLILALAGLAQWILHFSVVSAAVGLFLTGITRLKTRGNRGRAVALGPHS